MKSDSAESLRSVMNHDSVLEPDLTSGSKIGLLLPTLFPDIQWLRVALSCHTLFLANTTTFSRKSRSHRGKIRTPDGSHWIHIPLLPEDRTRPLASARIDQRSDWLTPLWRTLEFNYRNSIYFELYEHDVLELFQHLRNVESFQVASDLVLIHLQKWLEVELPVIIRLADYRASESPLKPYIDASVPILTEADSRNYLAPLPGSVYPGAALPEYRQHFGGFEPNCCWLDLLFERGPESWEYLDRLITDF